MINARPNISAAPAQARHSANASPILAPVYFTELNNCSIRFARSDPTAATQMGRCSTAHVRAADLPEATHVGLQVARVAEVVIEPLQHSGPAGLAVGTVELLQLAEQVDQTVTLRSLELLGRRPGSAELGQHGVERMLHRFGAVAAADERVDHGDAAELICVKIGVHL